MYGLRAIVVCVMCIKCVYVLKEYFPSHKIKMKKVNTKDHILKSYLFTAILVLLGVEYCFEHREELDEKTCRQVYTAE